MTDSDVAGIIRRLDDVAKLVGEVDKKVGILDTKFTAHTDADIERREVREQTCPQNATIQKHGIDLDALAGTLRSVRTSVDELVKWKRDEAKADAVSESWQSTLKASWNQTVKPIILPVVIALVLFRLGLK